MSSFLHFTVTGESPYPQKSGIFEVDISITDIKPSSSDIEQKTFSSIWKDSFHLNVKNGQFEETLGTESNPLPKSITSFTKLWIVVTDQFAPLGSLFEFEIPESMKSQSSSTKKTTSAKNRKADRHTSKQTDKQRNERRNNKTTRYDNTQQQATKHQQWNKQHHKTNNTN